MREERVRREVRNRCLDSTPFTIGAANILASKAQRDHWHPFAQLSGTPLALNLVPEGNELPDLRELMALAGCRWSAFSDSPWISIIGEASGSANGTATYAVAPFETQRQVRTGTITISGQTFSVRQSR